MNRPTKEWRPSGAATVIALKDSRQSEEPSIPAAQVPSAASGFDGRRLAAKAAAGGIANIFKIAIQLVMLPFMAHLLGPGEFGLYALALPTVTFFTALADGGMGQALARESEDAAKVWSTAFWALLGVGAVLAAVVTGWGRELAALADEPRLAGLMAFLSVSLPLITLSVLPNARLIRAGRLDILAAADLGSTFFGACVAVSLALSGAGAWSLAAQYVSGFTVRALVLNAASFARPTFAFDLTLLRRHILTGTALISGRLCEFAGRMVENLIYARVFGATALGGFAFANQASKFICEAPSGPTWGILYSVALREDQQRAAILHQRLLYVLSAAIFPVAILISAAAPEILPLLLGQKWAPAAPLLQVMLPFYALTVVATQATALLLAYGKSWFLLVFAVCNMLLRVAAVAGFARIGASAVSWGIGASLLLCAAAMFVAPSKALGPKFRPFLGPIAAPLLASASAGLVCWLLVRAHSASLAWNGFGGVSALAFYTAALWGLDRTRFQYCARQVMGIARRR